MGVASEIFALERGYVLSRVVPVDCSGFRAWQSPPWASVVVVVAVAVAVAVAIAVAVVAKDD